MRRTPCNKYARDLNLDVVQHAANGVTVLHQDCSAEWDSFPGSLDAILTSNFFEHLPDKEALKRTLLNANGAFRPGGALIMMGPNVKYLPGAYWDFFDHCVSAVSCRTRCRRAGPTRFGSCERFSHALDMAFLWKALPGRVRKRV
ncbi:MAG: hypothetical protein JO062_01750 [Bryobacterales bacterium]|nr:hypothetical protein [Bryobacterales bacterium]